MAHNLPGPWEAVRLGSYFQYGLERYIFKALPPLQVAIESCDVELVKLLLRHGASANVLGLYDYDMMQTSVWMGSEDIVRLLLPTFVLSVVPAILLSLTRRLHVLAQRFWAAIKDEDRQVTEILTREDKAEILTAAAQSGHIQIVEDLDSGVKANAKNNSDMTPLQEAAFGPEPSLQIMKLLIKRGARVDYRLNVKDGVRMPTPLQLAIAKGNIKAAEFPIRPGADPNASCTVKHDQYGPFFLYVGSNALCLASQGLGTSHLVKMLLGAGAKPDHSSLKEALLQCENDAVQILLDAGAPLSIDVLFAAAKAGKVDMIRHCLDAGFDVNSLVYGRTPLVVAAEGLSWSDDGSDPDADYPATYDILLDCGADVNLPGTEISALECAIVKRREGLITRLLSKGAHCDKGLWKRLWWKAIPFYWRNFWTRGRVVRTSIRISRPVALDMKH